MRMFRGYVNGEPQIRSMMGREFLVLPVVAFQAGVWQGMNSATAEYTPLSTLEQTPQSWNGRPVVADHPTDEDGWCVSAGDPDVFASQHLGWIFNARVEDGFLLVDAWIDMETPSAMSANVSDILDKIEENEPVEVSIGAFVKLQKRRGTFKGKKYGAMWTQIIPDHLAFLSGEDVGACSTEDGCGVRFEKRFDDDTAFSVPVSPSDDVQAQLTALRKRSEVAQESVASQGLSVQDGRPDMRGFLANGMFDRDVRELLNNFLRGQFNAPYVLAFSDDRVVFDDLVYDENGYMSIQIFVADYAIDENNQVSLTSSIQPAWLAVAPIPFNSPEGDPEMSDAPSATAAGASTSAPAAAGKTCDCPDPQPKPASMADLKTFLADTPLKGEIESLESLREQRRQDLIACIGEDAAEGVDLQAVDLNVLEAMAQTAEKARARTAESPADDNGGAEPAAAAAASSPTYHGRPGASHAPAARRRAPKPPKVFGDRDSA